eukprot:GHVO01049213.1.p1 GENE.GHVO01049213.1~~GHVO01049213.1.p1  ORF type:complete len:602 (+),score=100.31 GHVO01049213.1:23-1807(+)
MPQNASVGLITFGKMCHVYETGYSACPKSYVFRGEKLLTTAQIQSQLGLHLPSKHDSYLQKVADCDFVLSAILDDLQRDTWNVPADGRKLRCTGIALHTASTLLELCRPGEAGRIMLFAGGPCTYGPGLVVEPLLTEHIRHHIDLTKETSNARHVKEALKVYTEIAYRSVRAGHAIDIFASSLDQCGLYEMRVCCDKTGGYMVMSDSFSLNVFTGTLLKVFQTDSSGNLSHGYVGKMEIHCSKEFKVCGAIGSCLSAKKKTAQVSDTVVGEGETSQWIIGAIDPSSTVAFYYEITNTTASNIPPNHYGYLQFQTIYNHPDGKKRLRVTSVHFKFANPNGNEVSAGFDQDAAAVLMARLAVYKTETDEPLDVMRWLDRKLIRLVSRFADYQKDNTDSFQLPHEFLNFPQYMYHLRRSPFLQTFNSSPDETAYYRTCLFREPIGNSIVMIQPALLQYDTAGGATPRPVPLDIASLRPDCGLLLDSFFHVVVWIGDQIKRWKDEGYQDRPDFAHFKALLQAPLDDAKHILDNRVPVPKFVVTHAGGSQARFLLAKVNPSTRHTSEEVFFDSTSTAVVTDDVPLDSFMNHLIRLAVQS